MVPWSDINIKTARGLPDAFCIRGNMVNVFATGVREYNLADMRKLWDNLVALHTKNPKFMGSLYLFQLGPRGETNIIWLTSRFG